MLLTTVNSRVVKCFLDVVHVILMPFMEPGCWILCHHVSLIYVFLISSKISFLNCINNKTQTVKVGNNILNVNNTEVKASLLVFPRALKTEN